MTFICCIRQNLKECRFEKNWCDETSGGRAVAVKYAACLYFAAEDGQQLDQLILSEAGEVSIAAAHDGMSCHDVDEVNLDLILMDIKNAEFGWIGGCQITSELCLANCLYHCLKVPCL